MKTRQSIIYGIFAVIFTLAFAACGDSSSSVPDLSGDITITPAGPVTVGTQLTANYTGTETVSYQWKRDSTNVNTNSRNYTPDQVGSYTVTVSAEGFNSKTSAVITVISPSDLTGDITITPAGPVTIGTELTANYTGTETISYQWKRGTTNVGTNSTYTSDQAGSYTVTVSATGYSSKTSVAVTVTAIPLTLTITEPSNALTPILTDNYTERTATFTATVGGFISATGAANVELTISSVAGLTFSGQASANGVFSDSSKTFTITVTYNGTREFASGSANININLTGIPTGYTYSGGTQSTSVSIIDGQNSARAIPITQTNIGAFNIFTTDTGTRSAGLQRHYKLTEDITLTGENNWTAIGIYLSVAFLGSFDGQGHSITGLTISTNSDNQGLFGIIGTGSVIRNVGLVGSSITGKDGVGGIVGCNYGTVTNCYATGNVSGTDRIGGVVGYNTSSGDSGGTVSKCYATGNVSGTNHIGGVVGYNEGRWDGTRYFVPSRVANCYATGDISGTDNYVGGVVGYNTASDVSGCYATGNISGNSYVGGVVGYNRGSSNSNGSGEGDVRSCVALNQSVKGSNYVSRVVGNNGSLGTISNNFGFSGVLNQNNNTFSGSSPSEIYGESITATYIAENATMGGRFTARDGWTVQVGKLPGLFGEAVDLPAHLQQ